ncbi:hypothetical protein [Mycobacterium sp. MS1601]|nr:hypothetical protein [Mycobacterium sp. MS1601]
MGAAKAVSFTFTSNLLEPTLITVVGSTVAVLDSTVTRRLLAPV